MRRRSRIGRVAVVVIMLGLAGFLVGAFRHDHTSTTTPSATTEPGNGTVSRWGEYIGGNGKKAIYMQTSPTVVPGTANVVSLDASNSSSYALECDGGASRCATDGVVMAWGDGKQGQLGNGRKSNSLGQPVEVTFPSGVHIVSIGESRDNGYAIDQTGQGWAWGADAVGSLCLPNGDPNIAAPVKVPGITKATQVQGGQDHVLWLLSDKTVEGCGENLYGQVGDGNLVNVSHAVAVKGLTNVIQISCGNQSSAALTGAGHVYMWGRNTSGQIGVGSTAKSIEVPTLVKLPAPVIEISAGGDLTNNGHTLALLDNHAVYAWGEDADGQLGVKAHANRDSPGLLPVPKGVLFVHVDAGGADSVALDSLGNLWTWGNGRQGEIGNGTSSDAAQPVEVDHHVNLISATANNVLDSHVSAS